MSDATFAAAIKVILAHEGGYANDPLDFGGITNFGLTLRFLNAKADPMKYLGRPGPWTGQDVKNMSIETAKKIYYDCIWLPNGYDAIVDALVATKVFDMAVNMGEVQAEKLVQRACNNSGTTPALFIDGNLGPKSFAAINAIEKTKMLRAIQYQAVSFYNAIVQANPTQQKFLRGWLMRANWPF